MEISSILIGIVLLTVSVGVVSLPFRKKQRKGVKTSKAPVKTEERRDAVLSALRELDFDFRTGKVSEEDYASLRARLLTEAAQYMEKETEEDQKLEALIQSRRAAHQTSTKCDHCGASVEADQHFCSTCGKPLTSSACPSCGKKIRAGDLFCTSCGSRLEVQVEAAGHS